MSESEIDQHLCKDTTHDCAPSWAILVATHTHNDKSDGN